MEHNRENILKTIIIEEQNLNIQMVEFRKSIFFKTLCAFWPNSILSQSLELISQFNTFSIPHENPVCCTDNEHNALKPSLAGIYKFTCNQNVTLYKVPLLLQLQCNAQPQHGGSSAALELLSHSLHLQTCNGLWLG